MSLFLVRATPGKHNEKNATAINGYIVDAVDEAAARVAASAASPNGESYPKAAWQALPLAGVATPILIEGAAVIPANGERLRGQ